MPAPPTPLGASPRVGPALRGREQGGVYADSFHRGCRAMTPLEAILLTIVTASTPLLIAAIGELVAERAGVLNLGVEGMMAMGAACGFAAAIGFDSTAAGIATGILAGAGMAAIFAFAVLGLAANQVGSGLALTILGLGLSGLIGAPFVGARRDPIPHLHVPGLADLPGIGRLFFGQDAFVYVCARARGGGGALPEPLAGRPDAAGGRRKPCLGPCARLARPAHALSRHPVRRRLRGPCRRLSLARLHALLVARA